MMRLITSSMLCVILFCAVASWSQTRNRGQNCLADCTQIQAGSLTVNQQEDLITIWKDEKLAFDVYTALNGAYTLPIFATIASSEEQHLIAVERLLERNGVNVPVAEDPTALVTQGSSSLVAAMEAGIYIERKDIDDLTAALKEVSGRKDLLRVYTNLLSGSEDHLEAFESHLALLATNQ